MTVVNKIIKEYGSKAKRLRIDINKTDGLTPGSEVCIIPVDEYQDLQQQITDLKQDVKIARAEADIGSEVIKKLEDQIQDYKTRDINLEKVVTDALSPIDKHYTKELENKDKQYKQLEIKYNSLLGKAHKNNLELMGLNAYQLLIQRKYKKLIMEFDQELTILLNDQNLEVADAPRLPKK